MSKQLETQAKSLRTQYGMNVVLQHHTKDMDHDTWVSLRKDGLGGSEVAALCGLSKYESRMSLWTKKTGKRGETESTEQMRAGNLFEEAIAKEFEARYGWPVKRMNYIYSHPDYSWTRCNIDFIVQNPDTGNWGILEIKNPSEYSRGDWETNFVVDPASNKVLPPKHPGTIPAHYDAQGQYYAGCAGMNFIVTCGMIGGFSLVPVYRQLNIDHFNMLIAEGQDFWDNHVVTKKRPDLEVSLASSRETLADLTGEVAVDSSEVLTLDEGTDLHTLFKHHLKAKEEEKEWKKTKDELAAEIMNLMGDKFSKVEFKGKSAASWSKPRKSESVDKKLLLEKYPQAHSEVVTAKTGKPSFGIRFKG